MKNGKWIALFGCLAVSGASSVLAGESMSKGKQPSGMESASSAGAAQGKVTQEWVNQTLNQWPDTAKKAAQATIQKYGLPQEATPQMFIWRNNGPWKRTIVSSEEIQHDFPIPHKDVLEQFVNMDVPADKFDDLASFDGSVIAERTRGELSARCDQEGANILAVNLAKDIIDGKKNVDQARQAYTQAIAQMKKGKMPETMKSLQFEVVQKDITNPDQTTLKEMAE